MIIHLSKHVAITAVANAWGLVWHHIRNLQTDVAARHDLHCSTDSVKSACEMPCERLHGNVRSIVHLLC